MASFNYRLNPLYAIKECSSCGALYTADFCCSKRSLEDKILVPVPDSSQRPLIFEKICLNCGDPVHGLYCRQCALIRKTLEEVFQDFQDTSESSDDDTNVVNAPREPCVMESFVNDALVRFSGKDASMNDARYGHYYFHDFQQQYLCCENCGGLHETFQCQPINEDYYHEQNSCYDSNSFGFDQFQPPQYTINHPIFNAQNEFLNSQNKLMEQMTSICDMVGQYMQKKEEDKRIAEEQAAKDRYWKIPICYDDDEDYTIAITPVSSTKEPVDSLIMEDEHLDTIPATESDEVIKSSVENLVQIPSESKGIPDSVCDMPLCNNPTPLEAFKEHSETVIDSNDDSTSSDDDSPYGEDIDYVDASPPDAEIVSLEVVESVIPKVGGIDDDILLTIKDDILREKLLNVNLLIANIEALKDNPTPSSDVMTKSSSTSLNLFLEETNTFDNSLTESKTFCFDLEENSSGSTTTLSDYSLPDYEIEPDQGGLISIVISNNSNDPLLELPEFESFHFNLYDDPSFPRPPPKPPDVEICLNFEPDTAVFNNFDKLNEDECFDPGGGEIVVSQNVEDDYSFTFVIRTFLPFLTYLADSPLLLSTRSEDTIFDPGIST
ncbi:hypothetical protein Tco_0730524 [Tanacetum coccineum]|uniref:Uncharacterized protein n=1 Tax=Tanacetum coccineum TaxID=301880 RepID=A0ABQ4YV15_9ASTR